MPSPITAAADSLCVLLLTAVLWKICGGWQLRDAVGSLLTALMLYLPARLFLSPVAGCPESLAMLLPTGIGMVTLSVLATARDSTPRRSERHSG